MRKTMIAAIAAGVAGTASADIIISEVVDATLAGGNPKFVELTNTGNADYTFGAGAGIIVQSNANTDLDIDVDLTGVVIPAGASYVIQSSSNDGQNVFFNTYGFHADLYTPAFFSNGDDRYIVTDGGILDIHGQIDTDGTGEAWEYTDGYAYRLPDYVSGVGSAFDISQWFHSGVNGLETGDDVTETQLILANTTPGTHNFVPAPASAALLGLGGIAAIRRRR